MFCNLSFQSDPSIQNCSWWNWICTLCQIVTSQPFAGLSVAGTNCENLLTQFYGSADMYIIYQTFCRKYTTTTDSCKTLVSICLKRKENKIVTILNFEWKRSPRKDRIKNAMLTKSTANRYIKNYLFQISFKDVML